MSDIKVASVAADIAWAGVVLGKIYGIAPVAHWSWFWVLSPVWLALVLLVAALIFIAIRK